MPRTKKRIMEVLMGRAEKGAARMDIYLPGWYRKIYRNRLNLRYGDDCILGQCFNEDYLQAMKAIRLKDGEDIDHGFFLDITESRNYSLLTKCWKTLISQRLADDEQKTWTATIPTPSKNASQCNLTVNAV